MICTKNFQVLCHKILGRFDLKLENFRNSNTIEIRRFRLSDLPSVVKILQSAFLDVYEHRGSKIKKILYLQFKYGKLSVIKRSLEFLLTNTYDEAVFVAEEVSENKVVAVAKVGPISQDVWSLRQIATLPNYRGRNVGTQLLKRVMSYVKSKGGEKIQLYVRTDNASAIKLYSKLGFNIANELHLMVKDL